MPGLTHLRRIWDRERTVAVLVNNRRNGYWAGTCASLETHPAVAIWLWCRNLENRSEDDDEAPRPWVYKGRRPSRSIGELWTSLTGIWRATDNSTLIDMIARTDEPKDDDQLDAFVGWVLGTLLDARDASVDILGDTTTGAIALPVTTELKNQFNAFAEGHAT